MEQPRERVAIIGSGLAGLVSANLLFHDVRQRYAVSIFESGKTLALDAASISIPDDASETPTRVDLPMRAFAGGYYNNLKALYDCLRIEYHSQPFLFEFATCRDASPEALTAGRRNTSYFTHASNLHQMAPRPSRLSMASYLMQWLYLALSYSWFAFCCFFFEPRRGETLQQYLDRTYCPRDFVTYYLLPLLSSVSTCPHDSLLAFPASDIVGYKRRTHGAPHYTVSEGVAGVQERLVKGIDVTVNATVTSVEPCEKGVRISWFQGGSDAQRTECFDKVILAIAPDVVGRIFRPLQHHMQRIPTAVVESVVHTDWTVLHGSDSKNLDRRGAQLIHLNTATTGTHTTESHHVQPCGVVVTTCPFTLLNQQYVVQRSKFTRVLRSPESQRIVNAIFDHGSNVASDDKSVPRWRNGEDNVWLVGGWCWDGMVLLEGCVVSAMRVADAFDVAVPWRH